MNTSALGRAAETAAAKHLEQLGFTILATQRQDAALQD